jgi:hypothetical protein
MVLYWYRVHRYYMYYVYYMYYIHYRYYRYYPPLSIKVLWYYGTILV